MCILIGWSFNYASTLYSKSHAGPLSSPDIYLLFLVPVNLTQDGPLMHNRYFVSWSLQREKLGVIPSTPNSL